MDSSLPSRVDRATLDRVLKRASELQGSSHDGVELLSDDETIALGREVGLPPELIKQALMEERVRINIESPTGALPGVFSRVDVMSQRVVQGSPERMVSALARWLEEHESFVVQRTQGSVATFEPMEQFARVMRRIGRAFRGSGRPYFERVELIKTVVTPLEPGYEHVALVASVKRPTELLISVGVGLLLAAAPLVILVAIGAFSVVAAAIGYAVFAVAAVSAISSLWRRSLARLSTRIRVGLDRALDELQRDRTIALPDPAPRTGDFARNVGKVVRDLSSEVRRALDQ